MRAAFVNLTLGGGLSGVSKAFHAQARAAECEGLPFDFVIVNPERDDVVGNIRYARYRSRFAPGLLKARHLASVELLRSYDLMYLRYPTAVDLDPLAFLRLNHTRVVTIHHSKEIPELLSAGRTAGLVSRATLEWLNGRRILSRVAGIVGVTDEIRAYEVGRAGRAVASSTIANGVDVERVPFTGFKPFDGRELRLVVVASTFGVNWHGIDRLLAALEKHSGLPRVILDVVGRDSGAPAGTVTNYRSASVHHHGELDGDALDAVLRNTTLAVGTLALFRKNLVQACALKVREYIARGLPFIYAYDDVDVPHDASFALNLPATEKAISIEQIAAFAERTAKTPELSNEMRDYAARVLDWRVKLRGFHAFARSVA